jgi:hypothetical protein
MRNRFRFAGLLRGIPVSAGAFLFTAAAAGLVASQATGQTSGQRAFPGQSSQVQVAYAENPGEAAARQGEAAARQGEAAARQGTVHRDSQVVPAGGHMLHKRQHVCPKGGCGPGGTCQGTCVVRPGRFGYYATQWRAWPGDEGVRQTSLQQMTPVSPPASAIPSVDEEALMPSSLMPDDDEQSFGSDNFGFEEVNPAPQLPPPGLPQNQVPAPGDTEPDSAEGDGAADGDSATPAAPGRASLFDKDPPAEKPSLFDEPAAPQTKPEMPEAPADDKKDDKKDESLDNLFDDFGRASKLRSDSLRQRLAVANQTAARQQAQQRADTRTASGWMPRQLPDASASQPINRGPSLDQPSQVVPTSALQQTGARSNPLR